jgi:hypothetical protein
MLNNLPKRSGVEKLLPCTEYILQRSDRILVHLVGDLPKAIVELSNGPAGRIQPTRSFPRQLLALLTHSLGFTHYKTSSCPRMPGKCTKQAEMNSITLKRRQSAFRVIFGDVHCSRLLDYRNVLLRQVNDVA